MRILYQSSPYIYGFKCVFNYFLYGMAQDVWQQQLFLDEQNLAFVCYINVDNIITSVRKRTIPKSEYYKLCCIISDGTDCSRV